MKPIKVLLVDDEEDFVTTVSDRIKAYRFDSDTALSGEQAIELVAGQVPDVMVLDLKMPGMDGITTLKEVRKLQLFTETLILTGHGTIDTALEAIKLGAYDYLTKPCEIDELVEKIEDAREKNNNNNGGKKSILGTLANGIRKK